jgi:hypothetical protein
MEGGKVLVIYWSEKGHDTTKIRSHCWRVWVEDGQPIQRFQIGSQGSGEVMILQGVHRAAEF